VPGATEALDNKSFKMPGFETAKCIVRYWHLPDNQSPLAIVRNWTDSGQLLSAQGALDLFGWRRF